MRSLLIAVFAASVVTACSPQSQNGSSDQNTVMANGQASAAPAPTPLVLLSAAPGSAPAQLSVGQEFGVQLEEHPSVGTTWEVVDLPPELRANGEDSTVPANVQPGGDRGLTTFRFVATRPGSVTLRMVNKFRGDPVGEANVRIVIR